MNKNDSDKKLPKLEILVGDSYARSYVTLNGEKLMGVLRASLDITPSGPMVNLVMVPDAMNLEIPKIFKALVKVDFVKAP